jgi:hypothetical protein
MRTSFRFGVVFALSLCATAGCRMFGDETAIVQGNSPLRPARSSSDSVKMEIIWARLPASEQAAAAEAWTEIDETRIDPAVRRELANNGLRAGVISGKLPEAVARALKQGEAGEGTSSVVNGESTDISADAAVHGRVRQLPRHQRMEIQASDVYRSLPLLLNDGNELSGRNFEQAQAIYALEVDPQPDSTTLVELTPELHHGAPRMQWTGGDGVVLHQAALRDREVFERLRVAVPLAPGDMLVMMNLPDCGSRLGRCFHISESSSGKQQKLILIRVAEVPPTNTFVGQ